jgi:hypothetical protein
MNIALKITPLALTPNSPATHPTLLSQLFDTDRLKPHFCPSHTLTAPQRHLTAQSQTEQHKPDTFAQATL